MASGGGTGDGGVTGGVGEMLAWQGERCWRGNGRGRDVGVTSGGGGGEREGGVTGGDGGGGRYGGVTSGVGEMLAWQGRDVAVTSGRGEMLAWQWQGERWWRERGDVGVTGGVKEMLA